MENDIIAPESAQNQAENLVMEAKNTSKITRIKAFIKKRRYWLIASVVILLIALGVLASSGSKVEYTTAEVIKGDIIQTVEASGELESLEDIDLSFQTSGIISYIYADIGEEVEAGDLILNLVSDESQADLAQAQEQVNKAEAVIDRLYAGATDTEIAIAQASLTTAEIDLASSKITGENSIQSALLSYQTAQDTYDNLITENEEDLYQSYIDLISTMRANVIEIRSALSDADEILGVENSLINSDFEIYLSANNPQMLSSAKRYYDSAAKGRDLAELAVYSIDETYTLEDVLDVADTVMIAIDDTAMTLYYTRAVLDATIIDTPALSTADIIAFKTSIDTARTALQADEDALVTKLQLLNSVLIGITTSETNALNSLNSAELAYTSAQSTYDATIATKETALASAQANYNNVTASVRNVDSASYYADLGIALAQLNSASARYEKTAIKSPINGVVTDITLDIGELATAGQTAVTVQTLDEAYMISLAVSESDIVKVTEGDTAEVTFDAYGDDLIVEAYVGSIDPAETNIEGVVYYNVNVYISDIRSIALKPGMSADVTIMTETRTDALYVPQRAILENEKGKYVRILVDNNYEERQILTGLRADGGLVEVLEGVVEGELIIVSIQE